MRRLICVLGILGLAGILVITGLVKLAQAATVQFSSTPAEKVVGPIKAGLYVRTDVDTPLDITTNETDKVTVYGSQTQPLQQKVTTYDLIITLDGEKVGVTTAVGDGVATETTLRELADEVSKETTLQTISGNIVDIEVKLEDKIAKETTLANININIGDIESKLEDKIAKETTLLSIDGKLSSGVHVESPVAVSGTFWQTTQPISNQALTDAQNTNTGIFIKERGAAKILTVAASGADFTTIGAAITYAATQSPSATNPYTIEIRTGTYTEAVTMTSYVNLRGVGTRSGVIIYQAAANVITLADNVKISNLTVRTGTTGELRCIVDNGVACTAEITNVGVESTAVGEGSWYGFYFSGAGNYTLDRIYLRRTAAAGGTGDAGLIYVDHVLAMVKLTNSDIDMRGAPVYEGEAMNTVFWITGTQNTLIFSTGNKFAGDNAVSLSQLEGGRVESVGDFSFLSYASWLAAGATENVTPFNTMTDIVSSDTFVDITLTDSTLNYSYTLPAKCTTYTIIPETSVAVKVALSEAGMTSNYYYIKAGLNAAAVFQAPPIAGVIYSGTLYFNCATAGTKLNIRVTTKP